MKHVAMAALVLAVAGLSGVARAQEKADPTGTWKWTVARGDQTQEMTLKLKMEEGKLVGVTVGRNGQETKIEEAKFENGEVSFAVARERNGQRIVTKYKGKLDGNTLKGTQEFERDGQVRSREWEAKRAPAEEAKKEAA